jgi:hypothetical protein
LAAKPELKDKPFSVYKYKFASLSINVDGLDHPYGVAAEFIKSVVIEHDYENGYFPFFVVGVTIPNWLHREMKASTKEITVTVSMQKGVIGDPVYDISPPSKIAWSSYIKQVFTLIMPDNSPAMDEKYQKEAEQYDGSLNKGISWGNNITIDLLLYRKDYLAGARKIVNNILTSANLPTAIAYVLGNAGLGGVLLSPPANYGGYSEFLLTPITVMEQLNRICNVYKLHTNGTLVYFGFDNIYLLEKKEACTAFVTNEYKTTKLFVFGRTQRGTMGLYGSNTDGDTKTNGILCQSVQLYDNKQGTEAAIGTGVLVVQADGSITKAGDGATTKVMVSREGGNRSGALSQSIKETGKVLVLGMRDIDLKHLEPNKEFVFVDDEPAHKRFCVSYRITHCAVIFENEGGYWSPKISAEFRSSK